MKDSVFNFALSGTVFFLLGGVYLTEKAERVSEGELFIGIGLVYLVFAISRATRPTKK